MSNAVLVRFTASHAKLQPDKAVAAPQADLQPPSETERRIQTSELAFTLEAATRLLFHFAPSTMARLTELQRHPASILWALMESCLICAELPPSCQSRIVSIINQHGLLGACSCAISYVLVMGAQLVRHSDVPASFPDCIDQTKALEAAFIDNKHPFLILRYRAPIVLRSLVWPRTASTQHEALTLCNYDWIGFDMDHTLVEYNEPAVDALVLARALQYVQQKATTARETHFNGLSGGLSSNLDEETVVLAQLKDALDAHMDGPSPFDLPIPARTGYVLDHHSGNILSVSATWRPLEGYHGDQWILREELDRLYPGTTLQEGVLRRKKRYAQAWNGFEREYLDVVAILVRVYSMYKSHGRAPPAAAAGGSDRAGGKEASDTAATSGTAATAAASTTPQPAYSPPRDARSNSAAGDVQGAAVYRTLCRLASTACGVVFSRFSGAGFSEVLRAPEAYVVKRRAVGKWLKRLRKVHRAAKARSAHVRTFLLTNASPAHALPLLQYTLGNDWHRLFDLVILGAKKQRFFQVPTYQLEHAMGGSPLTRLRSGTGRSAGGSSSGTTRDRNGSVSVSVDTAHADDGSTGKPVVLASSPATVVTTSDSVAVPRSPGATGSGATPPKQEAVAVSTAPTLGSHEDMGTVQSHPLRASKSCDDSVMLGDDDDEETGGPALEAGVAVLEGSEEEGSDDELMETRSDDGVSSVQARAGQYDGASGAQANGTLSSTPTPTTPTTVKAEGTSTLTKDAAGKKGTEAVRSAVATEPTSDAVPVEATPSPADKPSALVSVKTRPRTQARSASTVPHIHTGAGGARGLREGIRSAGAAPLAGRSERRLRKGSSSERLHAQVSRRRLSSAGKVDRTLFDCLGLDGTPRLRGRGPDAVDGKDIKVISGGSFHSVMEVMRRLCGTERPQVLYFGDHVVQDTVLPRLRGWSTVAIDPCMFSKSLPDIESPSISSASPTSSTDRSNRSIVQRPLPPAGAGVQCEEWSLCRYLQAQFADIVAPSVDWVARSGLDHADQLTAGVMVRLTHDFAKATRENKEFSSTLPTHSRCLPWGKLREVQDDCALPAYIHKGTDGSVRRVVVDRARGSCGVCYDILVRPDQGAAAGHPPRTPADAVADAVDEAVSGTVRSTQA